MRRPALGAIPCVGTWRHGFEAVPTAGIRRGAAPTEEARIDLVIVRIERMPENPSAVGLPDFNDGINGWVKPLVEHPPGKQDALATSLPSFEFRKVGELRSKKFRRKKGPVVM